MTEQPSLFPALAIDLLADGDCVAGCLLAMDTLIEACQCRCGGRWHAALIWAEAAPWVGPSLMDPPTLAALRQRAP
jgi:hypothetical protein